MYNILATFYILILLSGGSASDNVALSFVQQPRLIHQTNTSLSIAWETSQASDGYYKLSTYPSAITKSDTLISCSESLQSSYFVELQGIKHDKFYYFQTVNVIGDDTLYSDIELYSPASRSSGEIEVYFNNSIKESIARESSPHGSTTLELENAILDKISNASTSIDYCMYNTHRSTIVDALIEASSRGVEIRVIYNDRSESSNTGFSRSLPFETLERFGDGLMHNKFLIIDSEEQDKAWVMSGSTNFTNLQMDVDPNHIIFIQDQNLAKAYEIEFEEMWGSSTMIPNTDNSKFGTSKSDNTPHDFMINDKRVELYFSPSDGVSQKINSTLIGADESIDAALLIFTKWETRDALVEEINTGTRFRAIIEDTENSNDIISRLEGVGARIEEHPAESQLHHKYAIIDEGLQSVNSKVITGSHNWSHSADVRHDENLLIIHDPEIANWFQQEFEARWSELTTATIDYESTQSLEVYPNPAKDIVRIKPIAGVSNYKILDIRGAIRMEVKLNGGEEEQLLNISHLEDGQYFITVEGVSSKSFLGVFIKTN